MRYSRQIILKNIGKEGQDLLKERTVSIIGLGAVGTVASELLTRAGIGKLVLVDRDFVELNNLQRQSLFIEKDVGKVKVVQAKEALEKINSEVKIEAYVKDLNFKNIEIIESDLILDCTDNLTTRFLINDFSLKMKIPWIYSAAIEDKGTVFNIIPGKVCFRCIFKEAKGLETCDTVGVLNTTTNIVGSLQVNEALKILLNKKYEEKMIRINVWDLDLSKIKVKKDENCEACKGNYEYLMGKADKVVKYCGAYSYQVRGKKLNLKELKGRLEKLDEVKDFGYCIHFKNLTIFEDGRAIIKVKSEEEARRFYSKYVGN